MIVRPLLIATLLLTAGCGSPEPSDPPVAKQGAKSPAAAQASPQPQAQSAPPAEEEGTCGAARLAAFIGRPFTPSLAPALRRQSGADRVRVQTPADTAPIDVALAPGRLNVIVDAAGRIAELSCG